MCPRDESVHMKRRLLCIPVLSVGAALVAASPSLGATATDAVASGNWSGYVASGQQFSKVSGSWVQPAAKCESGSGDAAFWVGIGGASGGSSGLEQAGSEVDCSDGSPRYSAWYELVPDGPVTVDLPVSAGDRISASVGVDGNQVSIALTNQTTGRSFTKTLEMDNPDTSSAEWIAEAPSACQGSALGDCQTVPLADFGSVSFTDATATAGGQTGTAAQWGAQAVQLSPTAEGGFGGASESTATASAVPSTLDGGSFSVAWQAEEATQGPDGGYDPGGYGGDPYGGDPYGGGYGYGGGDYGQGWGGYGDGGYAWGY
jgi:hypothetical protein